MNLSQIKLVVTDMDGTLLNSNHEVSDLFYKLFKELKKHNILFVAASGRPIYSIIEKLIPIKNDIIMVAENGGIVIRNQEDLLTNPIKKDGLIKVESLINSNNNIHPIYCTKSKAYFRQNSISNSFIKSLTEYYPKFSIINSLDTIKEEILKIALYHSEDSEKYVYPIFKQFEPEYNIKISGKHWVDISDSKANKGNAIKLIQKTNNISHQETLVFGDYNNDIDMLKLAKYSFAMENAHPNVKEVANFNTKSNDNFGVEIILEKMIKAMSI